MSEPQTRPRYVIADLNATEPQPCPCGLTRRAYTDDPDQTASLHLLKVDHAARTHYHKKMTEIYYFLEGEGEMELDGEMFPVRAGMSVMIKPGCRHRAVGKFTILNIPIPAFDPADEHFD
ncbi:cupin domain-containing protein [Planctomycetales bacterium ZRK34]|nr:cupin domain-containing protein [Planctomycetales bacterium ZRK34]